MPRLYPTIRPGARYYASLRLLESVKRKAPHIFTKSGVMVGLGEQRLEVHQVMDDMRSAGVDFLTMGQYLQPTPRHAKVEEFVTPQGVRRLCGDRTGQRLPAGRGIAADAVELSCRRRLQENAGGTRCTTGAFERLMPRHTETKHLPYTPEQLFDLVADVARYDEFLPWVVAVRVRSSSETETVADLVVGFNAFKERFTSRVQKERPGTDLRRLCRGAAQVSAQRMEVRSRGGRRHQPLFLGRFRVQVAAVRNPCGRDVRPCIQANDNGVRAARRSALRHQQIQRAKRRLKAHARAGRFIEEFVVGDDLGRIGVALGAGEDDGTDRLGARSAAGPAMPVIATATSASEAASAPRAIAQAVATLTAPKVSTTSSLTLS